jgi:chloramphenicol-sensitive protein RarD
MITEASLGYFINPLVTIALGRLFFNEKISNLQISAIFLASIAIIYQIVSIGSFPFVSLVLAFSFALYGLARKKINVSATSGLLVETILISPMALIYFGYLIYNNENMFVIPLDFTSWLLILAGLITIVPLLWFNGAVTRIPMARLGFLQYIGPSISFILAIFIYNEPLNTAKIITFILIWVALVIFSIDSSRKKSSSVTQ